MQTLTSESHPFGCVGREVFARAEDGNVFQGRAVFDAADTIWSLYRDPNGGPYARACPVCNAPPRYSCVAAGRYSGVVGGSAGHSGDYMHRPHKER